MSYIPMFDGGKPFFRNGMPSFCKTDCNCGRGDTRCENCCSTAFVAVLPGQSRVWGEFNSDGDLEETNTYAATVEGSNYTVTERIVVEMPTKFSRVICDGDTIPFRLFYTTDHPYDVFEPMPTPFVSWNSSWQLECGEPAHERWPDPCLTVGEDFYDTQGLIEAPDETQLTVELQYSACWDEYHNPQVILGSREYGNGWNLEMNPCRPYTGRADLNKEGRCCDDWFECDPCCMILASSKILAELAGLSLADMIDQLFAGDGISPETGGSSNGEPDGSGCYVFYSEGTSATAPNPYRVYTTVCLDGDEGTRQVCAPVTNDDFLDPNDELEQTGGSTVTINVDIIPPRMPVGEQLDDLSVCLEYNGAIFHSADQSGALSCRPGMGSSVCRPGGGSFTLEAICFPWEEGVDGTQIRLTIEDNRPVDDPDLASFDPVLIPFVFCGDATGGGPLDGGENCCADEVPDCEPCCLTFDFLSDQDDIPNLRIDGESATWTDVLCRDDQAVHLNYSLSPLIACVGEVVTLELEIVDPSQVFTGELCLEAGGDIEMPVDHFPLTDPEDPEQGPNEFCWAVTPPAPGGGLQNIYKILPEISCKSPPETLKIESRIDDAGFSTGVKGRTITYKSCGPAECCCDTFIPCCHPDCYFPADGPVDIEGNGEDGGPSQIKDTVIFLRNGAIVIKLEQVGLSFHASGLIDVAKPGCDQNLQGYSFCRWAVTLEITEMSEEAIAAYGDQIGVQTTLQFAPPGQSIEIELPHPDDLDVWRTGQSSLFGFPLGGFSELEDCYGAGEFRQQGFEGVIEGFEQSFEGTFTAEGGCSLPTVPSDFRCNAGWVEILDGETWRKATTDDLPEDFCDVEEI